MEHITKKRKPRDDGGNFSRLSDESAATGLNLGSHLRFKRNEPAYDDVLASILKAAPTDEQLEYLGEPSLKAARVLGEAKLATKSVAGLEILGDGGRINAEAVRRANKEWIKDRVHRRKLASLAVEASLGAPTKEQLTYPDAAKKHPVSIKALQVLGDDDLSMSAKRQIPNQEVTKLKALRVLGSASSLASPKAQKILGSSESDGQARALADKHWLEEMSKKADDFTREVVSRRPNLEQSRIPFDNGPVSEKALSFFGDEELRQHSLRSCKSRAPPKAIQILGEAILAGRKAETLTGEAYRRIPTSPGRAASQITSPLMNYRRLFLTALQ